MEPWNLEELREHKADNPNAPISGWPAVVGFMMRRFDKIADLKSILFVIGLRELGTRQEKYTKEEKQDVMNLAFSSIMALAGYFEVEYIDANGWHHFKQIKPLPNMTPVEQERLIKGQIVQYFAQTGLIKLREKPSNTDEATA